MHEQELCLFEGDALENRPLARTRQGSDEPRPLASVLEQLGALPEAVFRVTLNGGRPTRHPDFSAIVSKIREISAERLAVELDAGALDEATVARLVDAGVNELFVHVGGLSEVVHRETMKTSESARDCLEGVMRSVASGTATYVVVTPTRDNARELLPLVDWLKRLPERPKGLLLASPSAALLRRDDGEKALPPGAFAEIAARVFEKCHFARIEYGFRSKRGVAPCAAGGALDRYGTVFHDRYLYFRRDTREALERVPACKSCSLSDSCRGIERDVLDAYGAGYLRPIPLETSMDWKLRELNTLGRREYRNVSPFKNSGGGAVERGLLRVNGHCNMSCAFCFVDRTAPDFETEGLLRELEVMATAGKDHIVISGGEPSLHPDLPRLVRHARDLGAATVEIQTNGVRSADFDYAKRLVDAGLSKATVSLHSADPAHSDKITRLPSAFPKTVRAIENFRKLGIETQIAHVITKSNYRELPETVEFLARTFPTREAHLSVCFAIAQSISDLVYTWVVPRFSEIRPYVKEALDRCFEHGIGFGGMIGQGGYPPCMLDGDLRYYERVYQHLYVSDDWTEQFYKAERCAECSFDAHCLGVRRAYVDSYGDAEITPFQAPPQKLPQALASGQGGPSSKLVRLRLGREAR